MPKLIMKQKIKGGLLKLLAVRQRLQSELQRIYDLTEPEAEQPRLDEQRDELELRLRDVQARILHERDELVMEGRGSLAILIDHPPGAALRRLTRPMLSDGAYKAVLDPTISDYSEEIAVAFKERAGTLRLCHIGVRGCWSCAAAVSMQMLLSMYKLALGRFTRR